MAINLKPTTKASDEIVLVSRYDSAIDWRKSFPEFATVEEKTAAYEADYDHTLLVMKDEDTPTFFVFHNPKLTVHQSKIRSMLSGIQSAIKQGAPVDEYPLVWNTLAVGTREGGDTTEFQRGKGKDLTNDIMQGLEDSGVLREVGTYVLGLIFKQNATVTLDAQKK